MDPVLAIPAFVVFTVVGIIVLVRIATSPIRGARHIYNAVNPAVNASDKEESKDILKDSATKASSYFGFMFSCLLAILVFGLVSLLNLPYALNMFIGICGAVLLYISYIYFQNRLP